MTWRNLCFVLGALCLYQAWRGCHRPARVAAVEPVPCAEPASSPRVVGEARRDPWPAGSAQAASQDAPDGGGLRIQGFRLPAWAAWFAPQPGENLLAYRDRMVPVAQAAIAPQRARVARSRDSFAALVNLDAHQRAELDAAAQEAASAIQDRVLGAALSGDFSPSSFKPMTGVAVARDVLDAVTRANQRFVGTLREDQRAKLAQHPFDFGDYLMFSTRWEDALGVAQ